MSLLKTFRSACICTEQMQALFCVHGRSWSLCDWMEVFTHGKILSMRSRDETSTTAVLIYNSNLMILKGWSVINEYCGKS